MLDDWQKAFSVVEDKTNTCEDEMNKAYRK